LFYSEMPKLPSKDTLSPSETKVGHSFEVRLKENKIFVRFFLFFDVAVHALATDPAVLRRG